MTNKDIKKIVRLKDLENSNRKLSQMVKIKKQELDELQAQFNQLKDLWENKCGS
jgi:DNA-binding transcriptional MerR regulator